MKIIFKKSVILSSITTLLFIASVNTHAKIYKWTDANGQTHYTATPPQQKKQRIKAEPVRLVYDRKMPQDMLVTLKERLAITSNQGLISGGRYHSFKDFIEFPSLGEK